MGTYLAPLELHSCVGYELLGIGVEGLAGGHAGPSSKKRPSFRVFFCLSFHVVVTKSGHIFFLASVRACGRL